MDKMGTWIVLAFSRRFIQGVTGSSENEKNKLIVTAPHTESDRTAGEKG